MLNWVKTVKTFYEQFTLQSGSNVELKTGVCTREQNGELFMKLTWYFLRPFGKCNMVFPKVKVNTVTLNDITFKLQVLTDLNKFGARKS